MSRNNIGTLINAFDNTDKTVATFNQLFSFAPLPITEYITPDSTVDILEPTNNFRRLLNIGGLNYEHDFTPLSSDFSWDNGDDNEDDWDF